MKYSPATGLHHLIKCMFLFISAQWATCAPNPWSSVYPTIAFPCTSYCKYDVDGNNNLTPNCVQAPFSTNGGCTDCDSLLFVLQNGGNCIPHLINS